MLLKPSASTVADQDWREVGQIGAANGQLDVPSAFDRHSCCQPRAASTSIIEAFRPRPTPDGRIGDRPYQKGDGEGGVDPPFILAGQQQGRRDA